MHQNYRSPSKLPQKSTTHPSAEEPLMTPNSQTTLPPRSLFPHKKGTTLHNELSTEEPKIASLRRSSRVCQPQKVLSVQIKGKDHMLIPSDSNTSHKPVPPVEPVDKGGGRVEIISAWTISYLGIAQELLYTGQSLARTEFIIIIYHIIRS